jgi:hypothetical protein
VKMVLLGSLVAAATVFGLPGGATAATAASLAGVTTVTSSTSFSAPVVLSKDTHVSIDDISVRGSGRTYGVMLRRDGSGLTPSVWTIASGLCTKPGCAPMFPYHGVICVCGVGPSGVEAVLPKGRYHLYVVADGAVVTGQIRLVGLPGGRTVTHGTPLRVLLDSPPPAPLPVAGTPMDTQRNLYSAGATRTTGRLGGMYAVTSWRLLQALPKSVNTVGICGYEGRPPADAVIPYQYPCRTSSPAIGAFPSGQTATGGRTGPNGLFDEYVSDLASAGHVGAGTWSLGAFNNGESPTTEAHTQVLRFDYVA